MRSAEKIDKAYASIKTGMTLMVNGKPCKERIQKPISTMPTSIYQSQNNFHTTTPIVDNNNKRKKSMKNNSLRGSPKKEAKK